MSTHPTYVLKYFPVKARGEPIRYLLSYGGAPFQDVRIPKEEWPSIKASTPFGKVPVLEVDGKAVHQSRAICRFLGHKFGLGGADDWESLLIDIAVDTFEDFRDPIRNCFWDDVPASKEAKKEALLKETIPFYLSRFDAQVKANHGYLVNGKLTWADLYFVGHIDSISAMVDLDNMVANYPNLKALYDKVHAIPSIAAYVAKRPKTAI